MKKGLAFIFILVANITLLVHAAVPHHSHEGDFCLLTRACEDECDSHENESHGENHQQKHQGEHADLECVLSIKVIIPNSINPKQEVSVIDLSHFPLIDFNILNLIDLDTNHLFYFSLYRTQIPVKPSLYHVFINTSSGLRAPPASV